MGVIDGGRAAKAGGSGGSSGSGASSGSGGSSGQGGRGDSRRGAGAVRFDPARYLRRKYTLYLVTATLLLGALAGLRLRHLSGVDRTAAETKVILLEGTGSEGLWFEIVREVRGEIEDYRLLESASPAKISSRDPGAVSARGPSGGWLADGAILRFGDAVYRFERADRAGSSPIVYRIPIEEVAPAGGSKRGRLVGLAGFRRLDIGGDPTGAGGVRDRIFVPWEKVAGAMPLEAARAGEASKGVAMILPREGEQFLPGDRVFKVAAEVPGVRVVRPDGQALEAPVVRSTPGPKVALPLLSDGDRIVGPGFVLEFSLETAVTSEPVPDADGEIVAYQPKLLRYLTFREPVAPGEGASLVGGGARLVALEADGEGARFPLTGARRFLFVGRERLLGRFRSGPVPSSLPDREFLRLAREAFATGVIYEERGFVQVMDREVLEAVAVLRALDGAPGVGAGRKELEAFLEPIAAGQGAGEDEPRLRAQAATVLSRLRWEVPARGWGLSEEARERALALLEALSFTSGRRIEALLDGYNFAVAPGGLWVAGTLAGGLEARIDPASPEAAGERVWRDRDPVVDLGGLEGWEATADEGWTPVVPSPGMPMPPLVETGVAGGASPAPGAWRAMAEVWRPAHEPAGARLVRRYRRVIEAAGPRAGQVALAAPGHLEVRIDDALSFRGPGLGPQGGPGVILPLELSPGRHTLEATVIVVVPEAVGPEGAGIRVAVRGGPLELKEGRGAGWMLPGWEEDAALVTVRRLWRPLVAREGSSAAVGKAGEGESDSWMPGPGEDVWGQWEEEEPEQGAPLLSGEVAEAGETAEGRDSAAEAGDGRSTAVALEDPAVSPGAWLWLDEPASRTAAGGQRYLVLWLETAVPGPYTLELTSSALPRKATWNGAPLEVSDWSAHPPSSPLILPVQAPAGRSVLRLELDQPPAARYRVVDPPLVFAQGRPVRFKPEAVTWRRLSKGLRSSRAPFVDRDERSRPVLIVEQGYGPLRIDQEVPLGEHRGRGDTSIYFPAPGDGPRKVLELADHLAVTFEPPAPAAGIAGSSSSSTTDPVQSVHVAPRPFRFTVDRPALFFRQEDPLRPPFFPSGGYRVAPDRLERFRDDRDQLVVGPYRIEYLASPQALVRGELVTVAPEGIFALRFDPLPEEGAVIEPGPGELLRLEAGRDGVTAGYRGAETGATLYRPGAGAISLAPDGTPVPLQSGDRLALPRSGTVFRYLERQGVLAPVVPAGSGGFRVGSSLGANALFGPADGRSGLEQVFDGIVSGQGGPASRVRLTLDDDLQRLAREQLLRQLALLRRLGARAVENEDGAPRSQPEEAPEGALVLMDARTGAILAAVSEPDEEVIEGPRAPGSDPSRLRTWHDLRCHPGSTFKLVTALAALEQEDPSIRQLTRGELPAGFARTGGYTLTGATLPGLEPEDRSIALRVGLRNHKRKGVLAGTTVVQGIEHSLNTYFGYLSLLMHRPVRARWADAGVVGEEAWGALFPLYATARRFGFDEPLDLVPPTLRAQLIAQPVTRAAPAVDGLGRTVARGDVLVASPSRFPRVPLSAPEIANVGIGQGEVYATPLQMALVASVFATGGVRPAPHLVEGLGGQAPGEPPRAPWTRVSHDDRAVELVRAGMKAVVATGSAAGAFSDSELAAYVYGKTGTAERPARGGGTVDDSWFVGYIVPPRPDASSPDPANHELAFACQIPAAGLGGRHAAEVVDRLLRDVARYYGWRYKKPLERISERGLEEGVEESGE